MHYLTKIYEIAKMYKLPKLISRKIWQKGKGDFTEFCQNIDSDQDGPFEACFGWTESTKKGDRNFVEIYHATFYRKSFGSHAINFLTKFFVVSNYFSLPLGRKMRRTTLLLAIMNWSSYGFNVLYDFYVKWRSWKKVVVFLLVSTDDQQMASRSRLMK